MRTNELRDMSDSELRAKLRELGADKFSYAGTFAMGLPPEARPGRPNSALMRNIRHDTARILTIMREREMGLKR